MDNKGVAQWVMHGGHMELRWTVFKIFKWFQGGWVAVTGWFTESSYGNSNLQDDLKEATTSK